MNKDLFVDTPESLVPRDIRGLPVTFASHCPRPGIQEALANKALGGASVPIRRNIAISWVLANLPIKNFIPRESPTVLRLPKPVPKKVKPYSVLAARTRYRKLLHVGSFQTTADAVERVVRLLKLASIAGQKEILNIDELVDLKSAIVKYTPRQAYIAERMVVEWKEPSAAGGGGGGRTGAEQRQKGGRRGEKAGPEQQIIPEEMYSRRAALMELVSWKVWDEGATLDVNDDLQIGNKLDIYDLDNSRWHQAVGIKETRRGMMMKLLFPKKEANDVILLTHELAQTMIAPIFTHTEPTMDNVTTMPNIPKFEKELEASQMNHGKSDQNRLHKKRHHVYVSGSKNSIISPNKNRRVHGPRPKARPPKPFSNEMVGTECVLGYSYNVQKQYIGRRAIVLGTGMSSGGWVDIHLLNKDGTGDKRLRWRFHGLTKLAGDQKPTASKSTLEAYLKEYKDGLK